MNPQLQGYTAAIVEAGSTGGDALRAWPDDLEDID